MNGAMLAFPHTPSWRGAQLKHRDNFTSALFYTYVRSPDVQLHIVLCGALIHILQVSEMILLKIIFMILNVIRVFTVPVYNLT